MNPKGNKQKWFFEEDKTYLPNPSEDNEREYIKIETAINSPGTDDLNKNTKEFVIKAWSRENRKLADGKRKILQELKREPLSVENNNKQQQLAAMSVSYVEPRQYYRSNNPSLDQQILESNSESSGQREVNIPPEPPDENAQQFSLAEEQEIESQNPLEPFSETPEHSSSAEVQEIESGNPLEPSGKNAQQSSSAEEQEIESGNPLKPFGENAEQSFSAEEQEIESQNPLESSGETPEHSSSAEEQEIESGNLLESSGESQEQSSSAEAQKIESENPSESFNKNVELPFSAQKQKIEFKNPSKFFGKKAEQSSVAKKPRIESENALKPPGENAKQSFSSKKRKIDSETPLTELSLNRKSPTITAPQSHSTPKNNAKVPDPFDSALGNEIEDSVDESSVSDTSPPVNRALFVSAREDSSAVVEPVQKNEEEDLSDSGVTESNVAGQDSFKRFR